MALHAHYSSSILDFTQTDSALIYAQLSTSNSHWLSKIELLKHQLNQLPHLAGDIVLGLLDLETELDIEAVILYRGLVFPIAIDLDNEQYQDVSKANIHQQARVLKEQHQSSAEKFIVPILLTVKATPQGAAIAVSEDLVANTMFDTGEHLAAMIEHFSNQYKDDQIILSEWLSDS
ncbi:hypothetical protein [Vibrio sp. M260118]|uniref:hypothetical protein n=1 Tax=Vibrio sp. M260118 TaxID=3020896 RepID=UPI002F3EED38